MKKVRFCLIGLFLLTGIIACQKEIWIPEEHPATEKNGIRIPVRMENGVTKSSDNEFMFCFDDPTKVDISSTTGAATWTTGDQIVLCESNGVHTKWLYGDVNTETSEVTVTLDDGYSRANYAIYPASAATSNFTTPTVVYADSYSMDDVVNPETFSMAPMVAINSGQLNFYHVGAVLRLSLHYIPLGTRKIRVTFNGMTYVTGTYSVSNPGTASASTSVTSGSHNYVEFTKSTDFDLDTTLNIPLPTGDYSFCTGLTIGYYDSSASLSFSHAAEFSYMSLVRASGKKGVGYAATDLSLVHPITRAEMLRETANCYVVTGPGRYCIPLYYGNSIVGGVDNLSNAAPAKVNANDGVFVNTYNVPITSGNIITDLVNNNIPFYISGGKLIWSTAGTASNTLVIVDSQIVVDNGVGYLFFNVPSDGFQEGSAFIGLLKNGSTTDYVWFWHIWITEGAILDTEEYTNYEGNQIHFLNYPLGGFVNDPLKAAYYQFGIPRPMMSVSVYTETGSSFSYSYKKSYGASLGNCLPRPDYVYVPDNTSYDPYSIYGYNGSSQAFCNMWDATQTAVTDKAVVKTIYDPSPAGMSVPRLKAFTGFTTDGLYKSSREYIRSIGVFSDGWYFMKNNFDNTGSLWAAGGYRNISGFINVGSYGYYWTSCSSTTNKFRSNVMYFTSSSLYPFIENTRTTSYCIRPALCE